MKILLNTHILLWWMADDRRLPRPARLAIEYPANHIFVKWKSRLSDILAAPAALGRARRLDDGRWMG